MLKLFLWLRYLHRKKMVLLSIAAVSLSVSLLIVVASLFGGFINAFKKSAVETIGDIVIAPPVKFFKYPELLVRLEQLDGVEAATAMLSAQGLLHLGEGNVRAVAVWGIDPVSLSKVTAFKKSLIIQKGSTAAPSFEVPGGGDAVGGFVGVAVLGEPDEQTDEYDFGAAAEHTLYRSVVLTTGAELQVDSEDEMAGPGFSRSGDNDGNQLKRTTHVFTIVDIVFTGVYDLDRSFVYLPIDQLQGRLYPRQEGHIANQVQIKLRGGVRAEDALVQIQELWRLFAAKELGWSSYLIDGTAIETAVQMQGQYVAELKKQMGILLLIFGVVSSSVLLLIFCIFYMIVVTRRRDMAIVKSCGASGGAVALIFVGFGVCVGVVGSLVGLLLGYVTVKNINALEDWIRIVFGLKLWKSSVYMFTQIPNEVNWPAVLHIVLLSVVAAAVGALIPAVIAARIRPVDILRYE